MMIFMSLSATWLTFRFDNAVIVSVSTYHLIVAFASVIITFVHIIVAYFNRVCLRLMHSFMHIAYNYGLISCCSNNSIN